MFCVIIERQEQLSEIYETFKSGPREMFVNVIDTADGEKKWWKRDRS